MQMISDIENLVYFAMGDVSRIYTGHLATLTGWENFVGPVRISKQISKNKKKACGEHQTVDIVFHRSAT